MNDLRFPILGIDIPPMLGRKNIMEKLWGDLTKTTPDNISVVGPRYIGKSVLLKRLAEQMNEPESPYCSAIFWDLGHLTPRSDKEFLRLLCQRLGEGIRIVTPDYGNHLLSVNDAEFAEICEVIDVLKEEGKKILMLWDGFDKPLSAGGLTRNLWDNMLELMKRPNFQLVTATRKELHELIRDEESISSDFWGAFKGIVRLPVFNDADINGILATIPDLVFQSGAKTELFNWSAGFPPLFLEILNQVIVEKRSGQVDNQVVNQAARQALENLSALISTLWDDCPSGAKDLFISLASQGELLFDNVGKYERRCLIEKGFARQVGNKLKASCRMLQDHIQGAEPDVGSMARLFGTWENYKSNIRSFLERRLAHIPRFDERLYRLVARAIEDIPEFPDYCLNNLTSIEERSLDLIWQREFGDTKKIPLEIIDYWDQVGPYEKPVMRVKEQPDNTIPGDRGIQCGILQILTGSRQGFETRAKFTSKNIYVLINAIHSFRNRSEHADGQEMHVGVAVAAIMGCLELLSCLERELAPSV